MTATQAAMICCIVGFLLGCVTMRFIDAAEIESLTAQVVRLNERIAILTKLKKLAGRKR